MNIITDQSKQIINIEALSGIRFIAAMGVVIHHFISPYFKEFGPSYLYNLTFSGHFAVQFFFILSGFVLQIGWSRKLSEDKNVYKFYFKRLIRVYPLYLFSLFISINIAFNIIRDASTVLDGILRILSVLTMTQSIFPSTKMLWNFPAWFLTPLMFSYLLFPFISKQFKRNTVRHLILFWILTSIIIVLKSIVREFFDPNNQCIIMLFQFSPIFPIFDFILGVIIGEIFIEHRLILKDKIDKILSKFNIFGFSIIFALLIICLLNNFYLKESIVTILFSLLIFFLAFTKGPLQKQLCSPLLLNLSKASYAMYIIHYPVYMWSRKITIVFFHIKNPDFFAPLLICYLLLTIIFALLIYYFIENKV